MSDVDSLNECIDNGKCSAVLFKMTGCPYCVEMKEKLDDLGVEYQEREIDEMTLNRLHRETVPFLRISSNDDDSEDVVIENEAIERIREKLGRIEIPDD